MSGPGSCKSLRRIEQGRTAAHFDKRTLLKKQALFEKQALLKKQALSIVRVGRYDRYSLWRWPAHSAAQRRGFDLRPDQEASSTGG